MDTARSQCGGSAGLRSHVEILLHARFSGFEERDLVADLQPLASLGQAPLVFPLADTHLDSEHDRDMASFSLVHDAVFGVGEPH